MNQSDNQYATLSEAVEALRKNGYLDELLCTEEGLFNHERPLEPERFSVDSFHRFEGASDPADMSIVYAVSSLYYGLKGLLIGAFGVYATGVIHKMVKSIPAAEHEGQVQPVQPAEPGENIKV
jgi:hypothetical protein